MHQCGWPPPTLLHSRLCPTASRPRRKEQCGLPAPTHSLYSRLCRAGPTHSLFAGWSQAYCEENKTTSQMGKIVSEGYHALSLIHFYTCGPDEVQRTGCSPPFSHHWPPAQRTVASEAARGPFT
jgi:hypothetical protein